MNYTLILGSTRIEDCDAALLIDDKEVFRLRERTGDGQFCVDFDLYDADGVRLAKVAKNNIVYAAHPEKYAVLPLPKSSELVERATGKVIAKAEEVGVSTVRVTGTFYGDGCGAEIAEDCITILPGRSEIRGCRISGFGAAVAISKGAFMLGCAAPQNAPSYPYPVPFR